MGQEKKIVYTTKYVITFADCDAKGLVKSTFIMNLLQDVAGEHSESLGYSWDKLQEEGFVFLLTRVGLTMERFPSLGDSLIIQTWTSGARGFIGERHYRITDQDGNSICSAQTTWVLMDLKTGRPARPGNILDEFPIREDFPHPMECEKLPPLEADSLWTHWEVRYSDLDMNQHVNNTQYLRWLLDCYDMEHHSHNVLRSFRGNFLHEVHYGQSLQFYKEEGLRGDLISGRSGEKELFRFLLTWESHEG